MSIAVVLVDDQTLVRQGIRSLVTMSGTVEVVGEAKDGVEALEVIRDVRPDVVLLDLRMPRLDGIGVLQELQSWDSPPPVLVLTTFGDDDAVAEALQADARGYLLKDASLEELTAAIETLAEGGRLIQPVVTEGVLERLLGRGDETQQQAPNGAGERWSEGLPTSVRLTPREADVLRLMAAGWSNKEIAASLHLAEGTVKNNVSALLLKLGVRDRTRAVLRAVELGLVGGSGPRDG